MTSFDDPVLLAVVVVCSFWHGRGRIRQVPPEECSRCADEIRPLLEQGRTSAVAARIEQFLTTYEHGTLIDGTGI